MQRSRSVRLLFSLLWLLSLPSTASANNTATADPADDFQSYAFRNDRMPYFAFDQLPLTPIMLGADRIDVAFAPGHFDLPRAQILAWVTRSAQAVAAYYGRFPVRHAHVLIIPVDGRGVRSGTSFGLHGAASKIALGRSTTDADLTSDWIMTHEFVHFGFPSLSDTHTWIREGMATYVEPFGREQIGQLKPSKVWRDLVDGLPYGLPQAGDQGLDRTHTWGRTYWGGALFCLLADIEIRQHSANKLGLQDALRAIVAAGGTIDAEWSLRDALKIGDAAVGAPILTRLYEKMRATPVTPDLAALWTRLGVVAQGKTVVFNDAAPLAAVREAIDAGRGRKAVRTIWRSDQ